MQWTDRAIILSVRKQGETSAVIRVFSPHHGVYAGMFRGATSKANRGIIQPGNIVSATWSARLSEQLGMFKCELLEANAAHLMQDAAQLAALSSACAIVESALPERHPYPQLYAIFNGFLGNLKQGEDWAEEYVKLELNLLAESGFGLDLTHCAATETTRDLVYVSPKSGRAVSREAGEPYKDRLLKLPSFLLPPPQPSPQEFRILGEGVSVSPPPAGGRVREGVTYRKPNRHNSHHLIENARELRQNMTEAEKQLWHHLRAHRFDNYRFRRQHPLSPHYIADFVCLDKWLVIEVDGGQHAENGDHDAQRTAFLEREGYRVLRYWNNEILGNMEGVLTTILQALQQTEQATPSPTLPPTGGGDKNAPSPGRGEGWGGGNTAEILAGMQLTGYFLGAWLLEPHQRKLPAARGRLMQVLKHNAG